MFLRTMLALSLLCAAPAASAMQLLGISEFIDEMVAKHQFERDELTLQFERATYRRASVGAISIPLSAKSWPEYRAAFVNIKRVNGGLQFWDRYADELRRAEMEFGVPQETIVAIIGVETVYGKNRGSFTTFDTLATLAFDYPRRATFFRGELEQYLLLAREQEFDMTLVQGSYAGALGIPQFMPSSYRKFAVDYDNDGRIDLMNSTVDAIGSVANYLKQFNWVSGGAVAVRASVDDVTLLGSTATPRSLQDWSLAMVNAERPMISGTMARLVDFTVQTGKEFWFAFNNFDVIRRYNNSDYYVMTVFQLAEALREARASNGTPQEVQSVVMRRAPL